MPSGLRSHIRQPDILSDATSATGEAISLNNLGTLTPFPFASDQEITYAVATPLSAAPLPAEAVLLLSGLAGAFGLRRRNEHAEQLLAQGSRLSRILVLGHPKGTVLRWLA